ncbi:MAG TPA: hypothetical protein ENI85_03395 [Deltaproteobacteria bacterium]|nr:hypothetical protein [Deltaproteobacteria bacterium]
MSDPIRLDESIDEAVIETLEGMAFTDIERVEDGDLEDLAESASWARIDVIEPAAGELVLAVGDELAAELEEATTGERGPDPAIRLEVLGEMLNTLAGSWARALVPDGTPIALGIPKTGQGDWSAGAEYELAIYETDDEDRLVVALRRA